MKRIIYTTLALAILASCADYKGEDIYAGGRIIPTVGMKDVKDTRASGVINPDELTALAPLIFRVDQDDDGVYPDTYTHTDVTPLLKANITGNMTDGTAVLEFETEQFYRTRQRKASLAGIYPAITTDEWDATTGTVDYNIDGVTDILAADFSEGGIDAQGQAYQPKLTFAHQLSQIRLSVFAENAAVRALWGELKNVTIKAQPLTCQLQLPNLKEKGKEIEVFFDPGIIGDIPLANNGTTDRAPAVSNTEIPLQTDLNNGETPKQMGYCLIAPTDRRMVLQITIETDKGTQLIRVPSQLYEAGKAYGIVLKLQELSILPDQSSIIPWKVEQESAEGDINSAVGYRKSANCYIVKPGGSAIIFPIDHSNTYWRTASTANVIGESDAVTVELLWTDTKDLFTFKTIGQGSKTKVYVETNADPTKMGNAVLRLKKGTTVVWSWHIWVVDGVTDVNGWLDRNIGALSANPADGVKTFGMHYQWGRKDPFPGSTSTTSPAGTHPTLYNATGGTFNLGNTTSTQTVTYMVQNPSVYVAASGLQSSQSTTDNYWGYKGGKGVHDPCPEGYRVPRGYDIPGYEAGSYTWETTGTLGATRADMGGWLPAAGYRSSSTVFGGVNANAWYWTANPQYYNSSVVNSYMMRVTNATAWYNLYSYSRHYGMPVRCVKEEKSNTITRAASSNCYILKPGGHSIFIPVSRANEYATGSIGLNDVVTAEIIWQEGGSQLLACEVIGTGSDAVVRVSSHYNSTTKGNAQLAIKVGSVIKWSWHIWVTDISEINGWLDRALGATSGTYTDGLATYGLYYQWGRKDPFPRTGATTGTTERTLYSNTAAAITYAITTSTVSNMGYSTLVSSQQTMDWTVKNPMKYIAASSNRWNADSDFATWNNTKTIHDPCPEGYKIPSSNAWGASDSWSFAWNSSYYGRNTGTMYGGWYVAEGYRKAANGVIDASGNTAYYWSHDIYSAGSAYMLYFNSTGMRSTSIEINNGSSVRCIRE